ncbi:MAG: tRNA lysidine(34) synthetase TilS [Candidatus Shikimatogenerans bostrichidophilus]|nr:MAG: tRNA lysidine(34) synthetase TilS [Candidatus Shikimatogenerans bostrichidophilus]
MYKKINNFFLNRGLYKKRILLAVSGGIDSIVLLNILNIYFKNKKNLFVCNCNFQLNKNNKNNLYVLNYCYKNNINFFFKKFNLLKYIKLNKYSIQLGARKLRYKWFNKLLKIYKINYLITCHHLDDDIETFLINLLIGSSLYGLKGIKKINKKIIRPYLILNINKKDIYNYAIKNKIKWIEDKSNLKNIYLRNKIRNKLIPYLKNKFNIFNFVIKNVLLKLKIEYNIINFFIKNLSKKIIKKKYIYNYIYICIYYKKILFLRFYQYILYRFLIKYKFFNINLLNLIKKLKNGKILYSNDKKFKIIKDNNKLILFRNKLNKIKIILNNKIKQKIKINNKTFIFQIKKNINKNIYIFKKNFIYLNLDLINYPIYIKNWENNYHFFFKNKLININNILKKFKINRFFKKQILFLIDNNNNILSSLNNIFIYNNNYLITSKTKNILYFNFIYNINGIK